ncbi:symmetrical bis(5'-nucleosyl)-tetraphosphatase [Uliginosibacterium sp. TH139]|uniref:symmetrical bis(5'-nucleosyl)-tetraphosphatase n=1 Tax=Uliginosibacterium sp. TH139 TaxID=2067453 RepID=UPI000C7C8F37|nr:symmetrical bis(5'-nucleosyl)-tetraphosphatase [Uliginosibacterium sp. TH139]PLK49137.1 diadenosine tetraphosphatase [Uliginosibacterium sp. TH139]
MLPCRYRYVIGDIQGCDAELDALLREIDFDPVQDRLWVAGDMINRGPGSLAVLRRLMALGDSVVCVLGNHDLFFLAVVAGAVSQGEGDTLHDLLEAPDLSELVDWLRCRPLLHVEQGFAMVHAGLLPSWTIAQARSLACEVEHVLSRADWQACLGDLWGGKPVLWSEDLIGPDRLRIIVNTMCRLRFLSLDDCIELKPKGPPEAWPRLRPWYAHPLAQWRTHTVLHGHWSALGYRDMGEVISLDTGCVWGGRLSALRLEDRRLFQVEGQPGCASETGD